MKDQIVSFKTAKLVKEKGISIGSNYFYDVENNNKVVLSTADNYVGYNEHQYIGAPTQSLLQKWLREEHGAHIVIIPTVTVHWTFKIVTVFSKRDDNVIMGVEQVSDEPPYNNVSGEDFSTYEEALEKGLQTILEKL